MIRRESRYTLTSWVLNVYCDKEVKYWWDLYSVYDYGAEEELPSCTKDNRTLFVLTRPLENYYGAIVVCG